MLIDIVNLIISEIQDGKTFKYIMRLNKAIYARILPNKNKYVNQLLSIMKEYPDKNYTSEYILTNSNTPYEFALRFNEMGEYYSLNPNITMKFVNGNPEYNWSWRWLLCNSSITIEDIESNPDKPWKNSNIWANPNITLDYIEKYPPGDMDWYNYISSNPNITLDYIKFNLNKLWNWRDISCNHAIQISDIVDNPDLPWNWYFISINPNITLNFIKNNLDKPLSWQFISFNRGITWKDIESNPDLPWDFYYVSKNPNITLDIIIAHPEIRWDDYGLSANPNLTLDYIKANPDKKWGWALISRNTFNYY